MHKGKCSHTQCLFFLIFLSNTNTCTSCISWHKYFSTQSNLGCVFFQADCGRGQWLCFHDNYADILVFRAVLEQSKSKDSCLRMRLQDIKGLNYELQQPNAQGLTEPQKSQHFSAITLCLGAEVGDRAGVGVQASFVVGQFPPIVIHSGIPSCSSVVANCHHPHPCLPHCRLLISSSQSCNTSSAIFAPAGWPPFYTLPRFACHQNGSALPKTAAPKRAVSHCGTVSAMRKYGQPGFCGYFNGRPVTPTSQVRSCKGSLQLTTTNLPKQFFGSLYLLFIYFFQGKILIYSMQHTHPQEQFSK